MKQLWRDPFIFVIIGIILWFVFPFIQMILDKDSQSLLDEAQKNYTRGEQADNAIKRKAAFNKSLETFLQLEKQYNPTFGNGKLYYDIGNNFYQLEEYPWSILYYNKAAALRPRDDKILQNLSAAQSQLHIEESKDKSPLSRIFFFHNDLSMPERLQIFVGLGLLAIVFASAYVWYDRRWLSRLTEFFLVLCILILLSLGYSYYFSPIEAILVKSSALYRDAGEQYAKVDEEPVSSGNKVKVLDQSDSGKWIKIQTADGAVGFVPFEAVRII